MAPGTRIHDDLDISEDNHNPKIFLPAVVEKNESRVKRGFWRKIRRHIGRIPFANEAAAAYFCATDPATPARVKAILMAALAYFVLPTDMVPDFLIGFGFSDDATVLMTAIGVVHSHIKQSHRTAAAKALEQEPPAETDSA